MPPREEEVEQDAVQTARKEADDHQLEEDEQAEASEEGQPIPVGVEQSLPVDVEQQVTASPTTVEDDDDETTIFWKTSPFAVGRVKPKWSDEFRSDSDDEQAKKSCCSPMSCIASAAALFCHWTERVGNMSVLYQKTPKEGPPQIVMVAGPFWFITTLITIPLIVGISLVIYFKYITCYNIIWLELGWGVLLAGLLGCLLMTSLSNPGILVRHFQPLTEEWIWNDQALTYRPPNAKYDPICAVVVEGFDHVCPWVGTAIGAGNMKWFKRFLFMIGVCLVYDLALLYFADCGVF